MNRLNGGYLKSRGFSHKTDGNGYNTYKNKCICVSIHRENIFIRLIGSKDVLINDPEYTIDRFESLLYGLGIRLPKMNTISEHLVKEVKEYDRHR